MRTLSAESSGSLPLVHLSILSEVLGGGVGVGTLLLIEEDVRTAHARTLLKYFAAEGLACAHHVLRPVHIYPRVVC